MEKKKISFIRFMAVVVEHLQTEGHAPAAHVHQSALRSFKAFRGNKETFFSDITPSLLKSYEGYLKEKGKSLNTISTYMRALRSTYNRAVARRLAKYMPHLFNDVYTGISAPTKRALAREEVKCLTEAEVPDELKAAQAWFALMFLFCGMPFIDLARLRPCDVKGDMLTYGRHKTRQEVHIRLSPEALAWIAKFACTDGSPYLFPILQKDDKNYASALRTLNKQLRKLALLVLGHSRVSSYTARHSWATIAHNEGVSISVISRALGHTSIRTTEAYLAPLAYHRIYDANLQVLDAVFASSSGHSDSSYHSDSSCHSERSEESVAIRTVTDSSLSFRMTKGVGV